MNNGMSIPAFPASIICAAVASLCLVTSETAILHAQQQVGPTVSPSTLVAVIDLPQVFETHPTFKANMEALQQELSTLDHELETQQKDLNSRNKHLNELNPASTDYRELEADLVRKAANLQVQIRQAKKDFMRREALQYYAAYNEIVGAVNTVADRFNIGLVLRFDSAAIDPKQPESVARGMSRPVVLQRNLDITAAVVQELQLALAQRNTRDRAPPRG